jgi:hypothetical protein
LSFRPITYNINLRRYLRLIEPNGVVLSAMERVKSAIKHF